MRRTEKDQEKLSKAVQQLTGKIPQQFTEEEWASLCEEYLLQALYQGKHVAFRDHYEGEGKTRRLAYREILSHSSNWSKVQNDVQKLPENEQRSVHVTHVAKDLQATQ